VVNVAYSIDVISPCMHACIMLEHEQYASLWVFWEEYVQDKGQALLDTIFYFTDLSYVQTYSNQLFSEISKWLLFKGPYGVLQRVFVKTSSGAYLFLERWFPTLEETHSL